MYAEPPSKFTCYIYLYKVFDYTDIWSLSIENIDASKMLGGIIFVGSFISEVCGK